MPSSSMLSPVIAWMDTGMSCMGSARLVAVTVISSMARCACAVPLPARAAAIATDSTVLVGVFLLDMLLPLFRFSLTQRRFQLAIGNRLAPELENTELNALSDY